MFLTEDNRAVGKQLDRMASIASNSCQSCSSQSTAASSTDNPTAAPVPSTALMQALIRDLSFWDALPPTKDEGPLFRFPSPLPRRPKTEPINVQQQQQQWQGQPQSALKRGRNAEDDGPTRYRYQSNNSSSNEPERRGDSNNYGLNPNKGTIEDHNNNPGWKPQPVWKTAVDPMTGRTYYYDAVTRRTQWDKPEEVRNLEKQKKSQRRKKEKQFFATMENNILKSLNRGELVPGIPKAKLEPTGPPLEPRNANRNFRTLSCMDATILAELRDDVVSPEEFDRAMQQSRTRQPRSSSRGRPPLPGPSRSQHSIDRSRSRSRTQRQGYDAEQLHAEQQAAAETRAAIAIVQSRHRTPPTGRGSSNSNSSNKPPTIAEQGTTDGGLAGEHLLEAEIQTLADRGDNGNKSHVRRNTGGTIYVNGTMSNPDVEATIKCVCGVYRAHLVQASEERSERSPVSVVTSNMDVFNDLYHMPPSSRKQKNAQQESLPSLHDIVEFYQEFYQRSQMEFDTIIMSLIYVERLIKTTNVTPGPTNWRSVLFSCMVLASKVWDDLSMWNIDFSNVASANSSNQHAPGLSLFTLQRVNQLELALLKSLSFDVRVPASEYAKYYFLIRTMLLRSGLLEGAAKPLGKEEAKVFENRTSQYQDSKLNNKQRDRRTQSMFDYTWMDQASHPQQDGDASGQAGGPVLMDKVCLEQLLSK